MTPQIIRNYRAISSDKVLFVNTATLEAEILTPLKEEPFHKVQKSTLVKQDALALEVDHFIQCVLGRKKLSITGPEATLALRQVEEFVAKAEA